MRLLVIPYLLSSFFHYKTSALAHPESKILVKRENPRFRPIFADGESLATPAYGITFQVSLQYYNTNVFDWRHFCSGAIIGGWIILIPADCVALFETLSHTSNMKEMKVIAGANNLGEYETTTQSNYGRGIHMHPSYNAATKDYNFAVMELENCFQFNEYVKPIELPLPGGGFPSGSCITSGWNTLNEITNSPDFTKRQNELKYATVSVPQECVDYSIWTSGQETIFCGRREYEISEVFDFGGPLVCNNDGKLEALVTYPGTSADAEGMFHPWIFSDVGKVRDWVDYMVTYIGDCY